MSTHKTHDKHHDSKLKKAEKKHSSGKKTKHTKKTEVIEEVLVPILPVVGTEAVSVVDTIQQEPVLGHVHGQQHTHTEQETLVNEVIQQPITEVHKQPVISHIQDPNLHQTTVLPHRVEHVEKALTEEERLRIQNLTTVQPVVPQTTQERTFSAIDHGETVQDVTQQALIQKVIQPIVTEIHHQNVVHEVKQPLTRIITEKPIIQNVVHEPIETWNGTAMAPAGISIHEMNTTTTLVSDLQLHDQSDLKHDLKHDKSHDLKHHDKDLKTHDLKKHDLKTQ